MTYPKIFSLSTVGILKHYVHDYLFHPLRTDFIGANGVGKSIIADLLQLMFVYDTSLIKFGTDGVKTDERSIYKLPYGLSLAYSFLNIEVERDKFLTIGIAISSQISGRITPFVISRNADISSELGSLSLMSEQRIFAKDFVADGKVPDLKELADMLLNKHGLYINFFRTKEDSKRYYQFLYDRQILSINLSSDEHLNAFAKVIQSFSKAKSLDLSPARASRSLKKFLFDDSENDFEGEYRKQQGELERLLREFSNLDTYVKQLRLKQSGLLKLKVQNDAQQQAFKAMKTAEITILQNVVLSKISEGELLRNQIEFAKNKEAELATLLLDFPGMQASLQTEVEKGRQYSQLHSRYTSLMQQREELQGEISEYRIIIAPEISPDWQVIDYESPLPDIQAEELKLLIKECVPYLKSHGSPESLDESFDKQGSSLAHLSQQIESELKKLSTVIQILDQSSNDSVIGWAVTQAREFSTAEKSVILHFATQNIHRPSQAKIGDTFIEVPELLNSIEFTENADGCWVHFGAYHQYLPLNDTLSSSVSQQGVSYSEVKSLIKKRIEVVEQQFNAINRFRKGGTELDPIVKEFDPFLTSYDNINKVKKTAYYITHLGERIATMERKLQSIVEFIAEVRADMPSEIVFEEPEMIERELTRIFKVKMKAYSDCCAEERVAIREKEIAQKLSQEYSDNLISSTRMLLDSQSKLADLQKSYFDFYNENPELQSSYEPEANLDILSRQFQDTSQEYRVTFLDLVKQFDETRNEKHPSINKEVNEKTFDFSVLESVLLGKINHTDCIAQELDEANRNRMNMADNIKNSMVRIFDRTVQAYKRYKDLVYTLNGFFQGVKISDRFFFSVNFTKNETIRIDILEEIGSQVRNAAKKGELPFDRPVTDFIQEFFKRAAQLKTPVTVDKLLDPQTFFDLSVSLTDEFGVEIPGSTGETYSAIALLGVARLSLVQREKRNGLRFIILEELGSLDNVNFKTFPAIAKEYNYQIITMAPTPFRSDLDDEWYAHHLLKGTEDKNINYHPSASYFKTKNSSQKLEEYIKLTKRELDRT